MPSKGKCSHCEKIISERDTHLKCASCDWQTHAKCDERHSNVKTRIAEVTYQEIVKLGFKWYCKNCTPGVSSSSSPSSESEMLIEMRKICKRLDKIESVLSPSEPSTTYASVTKNVEKEIVIKSKEGDSSQLMQKVTNTIDPVKNKISGFYLMEEGKKCILKTRHGDIEKIATEIKKIDKNLEVRPMKKRKPRLKLIGQGGVSFELKSDKEIVKSLKTQNECIKETDEIKIVKKIPDDDSLIIETCHKTYKALLKSGYVLLGFMRCRVVDANTVPRCYKCSQLSHFEKSCTSNEVCCPKCGEEHRLKDCDSDFKWCINCYNENKHNHRNLDVDHAAYDRKKCTTLIHRQKILKSFFEAEDD